MKKYKQKIRLRRILFQASFIAVAACLFFLQVPHASAADGKFIARVSGRILLQVEDHGEAWYIYPRDGRRYYLGNGTDAYTLMRQLGLGITDANLARIPQPGDAWNADPALLRHVQGMILLQVEQHGEAWYVDPYDGRRHYMKTGNDAYTIMRQLGLGATTNYISRIDPAIEIAFIHRQGSGAAQADEYIQIRNGGSVSMSLNGWSVKNAAGAIYQIPNGIDLPTRSTARIFTNDTTQSFDQSSGIWNDNQDKATLRSRNGTIIDTYSYTNHRDPALMSMKFTSQAPYHNWSAPYGEACEEAILVMLDHFFRQAPLGQAEANSGILRLVDWENRVLGKNDDTGVEDTLRMAQDMYGYRGRLLFRDDLSVTDIRELLDMGKAVVAPASGRDLGNVHFASPGPLYHMILIIGYENGLFIAHDPGTQFGAYYHYDANRLVNAIHDLTSPESNIRNGQKAVLVIE